MRQRKRGRYGGGGKSLSGTPLEYPICSTCQKALLPHKVDIHARVCGKTNPMARSMIAETLAPNLQKTVIPDLVQCPTCKEQIERAQLKAHRQKLHSHPTIVSPAPSEKQRRNEGKIKQSTPHQKTGKDNPEPTSQKSTTPKTKRPTYHLTLKQARAKSPKVCARCHLKASKLYCRGRRKDGTLIYYCYVCIGYREQARAARGPSDAMDKAFWTQKTFDGLDTDERGTQVRPKGKR